MYEKYLKRFFGIIISGLLLIILSPIILLIAIAIKLNSKGPIFFLQNRVGKHREIFKIFKFRTMLTFENSFYEDGTSISNYDRVTKIGNFLRKYSLDELPQLINIVKGEMSIVGPRPTLKYQVEKYDDYQKQRLLVRPGLTGKAQVNGRNTLTWNEKIEYDVKYVRNITFVNDLKIILKTLSVVLSPSDTKFAQHDDISEHKNKVEDDVDV